MTSSRATMVMMLPIAAQVMTKSLVITRRRIVRTMIMSLCHALEVVTNSMATLAMTFFMVEYTMTWAMEDQTPIPAF